MTDDELRDADFTSGRRQRVHNWMTYLPEEYIQRWDSLLAETRRALYDICEERADNEHWD